MNLANILVKLFGDKKGRDLKAYQPLVALVTDIYPSIQALSNDELRARTKALQQQIRDAAKEQQEEIARLKASIPATEIQDRAPIFAKIDQLEKDGRIFVIAPSEPVTVKRVEGDMDKLGNLYWLGYNDAKRNLFALTKYLK